MTTVNKVFDQETVQSHTEPVTALSANLATHSDSFFLSVGCLRGGEERCAQGSGGET